MMTFENGYWIMNNTQYAVWLLNYNRIMNDPESSDELVQAAEQLMEQIAIEN